MSLTNLDEHPLWFENVWAKYLGEDTDVFLNNQVYRGNFLIFERSAIVHCLGGSAKGHGRTYKTKTKYWRIVRK